jgi:hypothetical protein
MSFAILASKEVCRLNLSAVISAAAACGLDDSVQSQVESALADLYAAGEVPESWAKKGVSPKMGPASTWPYVEDVRELLIRLQLADARSVYGRGESELNWHFLVLAQGVLGHRN